MFKNYSKTIVTSVTLLSILTLVLFVLISITRWQFADDYVFPIILQKSSVLSFAYNNYMNWDAKFLMPFFLLWFTAVKYISFKSLMILAALSFIGISFCILIIITDSKKIILGFKEKIISVAIINIFIFIILYDSLSELLYWMSATCYVHSMLLALIWLIFYNKKKDISILFILFTFFISTLPQNISVGLLVIIFIDMLVKDNKKQYYLLLTVFILGISASTFSPGSFVQLKSMQKLHYGDQLQVNAISSYFVHFFKIYVEALKVNYIQLVLFSTLFIILIRGLANQMVTKFIIRINHSINLRDISIIKKIIFKSRYYLASFFCLAVYWPTLLYSYRYYFGFYIFIFIAIIISVNAKYLVLDKLNLKIYLLFLPALIFGSLIYLDTLKDSLIVSNFIEKRNQMFVKNRGKSKVDLPSVDFGSFTRTVRTTDLSIDPNYCTNNYYSLLYQIDTVISTYKLTKEQIINLK